MGPMDSKLYFKFNQTVLNYSLSQKQKQPQKQTYF